MIQSQSATNAKRQLKPAMNGIIITSTARSAGKTEQKKVKEHNRFLCSESVKEGETKMGLIIIKEDCPKGGKCVDTSDSSGIIYCEKCRMTK